MIGFDGEGWEWAAGRGGSVSVNSGANQKMPTLRQTTGFPRWRMPGLPPRLPSLRKQPLHKQIVKPKT